jgi:threonyl-tRNA synthetase
MDAIGIYVANKENPKSEIEKRMYYIIEENFQLERVLREAEEAKKKLERNKQRLIELAIEYASLKEEV